MNFFYNNSKLIAGIIVGAGFGQVCVAGDRAQIWLGVMVLGVWLRIISDKS